MPLPGFTSDGSYVLTTIATGPDTFQVEVGRWAVDDETGERFAIIDTVRLPQTFTVPGGLQNLPTYVASILANYGKANPGLRQKFGG